MRLIDADALKERIKEYPVQERTGGLIVTLIEAAPTIDAVPVVRCKDCEHHQITENKKSFMWWHNCKLWCADISEDNFCSYGERKDGEG